MCGWVSGAGGKTAEEWMHEMINTATNHPRTYFRTPTGNTGDKQETRVRNLGGLKIEREGGWSVTWGWMEVVVRESMSAQR